MNRLMTGDLGWMACQYLDRLFRDGEAGTALLDVLETSRVELYVADRDAPLGRMEIDFHLMWADYERNVIRARARAGRRRPLQPLGGVTDQEPSDDPAPE